MLRSGAVVDADVENLRVTYDPTQGRILAATWDQPPDDGPWAARLLSITVQDLVAVLQLPDAPAAEVNP